MPIKSFLSGLTKSAKTTLAGILAAVTIIIGQVNYAIDDNPETNFSWDESIAAVVLAYGLIVARDSDKSSEDVGIK